MTISNSIFLRCAILIFSSLDLWHFNYFDFFGALAFWLLGSFAGLFLRSCTHSRAGSFVLGSGLHMVGIVCKLWASLPEVGLCLCIACTLHAWLAARACTTFVAGALPPPPLVWPIAHRNVSKAGSNPRNSTAPYCLQVSWPSYQHQSILHAGAGSGVEAREQTHVHHFHKMYTTFTLDFEI